MSEIKIGEYVRLKNGDIRKIVKINEGKDKTVFGKYILDKPYNYSYKVAKSKIAKHSFNIIDLIEVGDLCVMDEDIVYIYDEDYINTVKENGHKLISIVTLQQLENIAYKVEE